MVWVKNMWELMRPHQYIKNLFIFLPLFFAGEILNSSLLLTNVLAFIAFSLSASGIYILNDYADIEEDRQHPVKMNRPLASGRIAYNHAFALMALLLFVGLTLMLLQSVPAFVILLVYIIMNIGYCFNLKHIAILDIVLISIGFVLRLFIGSFVAEVPLSKWIVIMTFLLALFLALAKRRDDVLHFIDSGKRMRKSIDGYNLLFIDGAMMVMASVVIVTYLLYTTSLEVLERMQSDYLYLTSLFVIVGIFRYSQLCFVEKNTGAPTKIIMSDRFMIVTIGLWILSFVYLIYI